MFRPCLLAAGLVVGLLLAGRPAADPVTLVTNAAVVGGQGPGGGQGVNNGLNVCAPHFISGECGACVNGSPTYSEKCTTEGTDFECDTVNRSTGPECFECYLGDERPLCGGDVVGYSAAGCNSMNQLPPNPDPPDPTQPDPNACVRRHTPGAQSILGAGSCADNTCVVPTTPDDPAPGP